MNVAHKHFCSPSIEAGEKTETDYMKNCFFSMARSRPSTHLFLRVFELKPDILVKLRTSLICTQKFIHQHPEEIKVNQNGFCARFEKSTPWIYSRAQKYHSPQTNFPSFCLLTWRRGFSIPSTENVSRQTKLYRASLMNGIRTTVTQMDPRNVHFLTFY